MLPETWTAAKVFVSAMKKIHPSKCPVVAGESVKRIWSNDLIFSETKIFFFQKLSSFKTFDCLKPHWDHPVWRWLSWRFFSDDRRDIEVK